MHSYIVNKEPKKSANDIAFQINSIADVRELKKFLRYPPKNPTNIILNGLDGSSIESQNAILKLLEEPPINITFIIVAKNVNGLLPTILSRSQIETKEKPEQKKGLQLAFIKMPLAQKIEFVEKIRDREAAKEFISEILDIEGNYEIKESAYEALNKLKKNTNVGLTLTAFALKLG